MVHQLYSRYHAEVTGPWSIGDARRKYHLIFNRPQSLLEL